MVPDDVRALLDVSGSSSLLSGRLRSLAAAKTTRGVMRSNTFANLLRTDCGLDTRKARPDCPARPSDLL